MTRGGEKISRLSKEPQYYTSNFYEFFCKRIKEYVGED